MSFSQDDLLRPTLNEYATARAPYSTTTTFVTSFLGGPIASIAIMALNSIQLERLRRDLPVLIGLSIAYIILMLAVFLTSIGVEFRAGLSELLGERGLSFFIRLIALALFGIGYALHRKEQRSADIMGLARPNGWIAGLACIAGATVLQLAVSTIIVMSVS